MEKKRTRSGCQFARPLVLPVAAINNNSESRGMDLSFASFLSCRPVLRARAACCAVLLLGVVSSGAEVSAQGGAAEEDTTVVYEASYFAQWAPVTAMDMVNRIPGVNVAGGGGGAGFRLPGGANRNASRGGRGLGSGGGSTQILINGKRTAGKDNNAQLQLARINADQVNYIELIRGTGGDLDVRGSGQILNIVMFEALDTSSVSFDLLTDYYKDQATRPGGSISYSNQFDRLNLLVSAIAQPQYNHQAAFEESMLADTSANDVVYEDRIVRQTNMSLSTNLEYAINGRSSARFNALYAKNDNPSTVDRTTIDIRDGRWDPLVEFEDIPGRQRNWEIGGDYEYNFDSGARFKMLFIANENDTSRTRERFRQTAAEGLDKNLYLDTKTVIQERIVRGSYTFDVLENHNLELGLEGAQTLMDAGLKLGIASASGTPVDSHGGLVPVAVDNASSKVEELRYEPFAIHNWRLNSRMTLETSLVYESSEIQQSGEFSNQRQFSFVKPKFDYRFNLTPAVQLRMMVEKLVRQISFTNFVASTDSQDNDSNTLAGNRFLRPDYFWNYNFTAEFRLPEDQGVISANLYHHRHKDFLQRVDVSPSPDNLQSAAGNIGSGDMLVADVRASLRMNVINLPNLLINARASIRDSEVKDPFTGQERSFTFFHRGEFELGFRHDIPERRINWGMQIRDRVDGDYNFYDIDDLLSENRQPWVTAFAEAIVMENYTVRFDVRNATDSIRCRERVRYVGHISDRLVEELESNCSTTGPVLTFKISSTF